MKLIFFDIDGTLISDFRGVIPESARKAIQKARENGHICMINTGRTEKMVGKKLTEQVEFDGYVYGCGTMATYHDELLFHDSLTLEQSQRIMDGLKKHKIDAVLEGRENDYIARPEEMFTDFFKEYATEYRHFEFDNLDNALGKYDKLYAYIPNSEQLAAFAEAFAEDLDFIDREKGFFEIVPKGYSKAHGIRHMAELLHIPMEDTVAIGDSSNDLDMIQCAGIGIAMGNAAQQIKDIADYVTTDVDKDGIWNALEWLGVLTCNTI